jgi:hypothetical protein
MYIKISYEIRASTEFLGQLHNYQLFKEDAVSLQLDVQNGSGTHTVSYPMGTGGSSPGGKAAGP